MDRGQTQTGQPAEPDQARYDALQAEFADEVDTLADGIEDEGEAQGVEGVTDQEQKANEQDDAKPRVPYEELERRHKQLNGALREAREQTRQAQERLTGITQLIEQLRSEKGQKPAREREAEPERIEIPDIDEDPVGHFRAVAQQQSKTIEALQQKLNQVDERFGQIDQQTQQQREAQQLYQAVVASEQAIAAKYPDYVEACGHLESQRLRELQIMFPEHSPATADLIRNYGLRSADDLHQAMLNQDRIAVARQAVQFGQSPAEAYYNLALTRGWQPKAAEQGKAKQVETKIDATRRGLNASRTLSGGEGKTDNPMNIADLADLYATDPDAADRMFEKMARQGLLG